MSNSDEVVASRPRRRMRPKSKWRKYKRRGGGELKSEAELARALGEEERTVRNWRYRGLIPYLKLGHRQVRYRLDAVLAALDKKTVRKRHFYQQPL
jgi:hypothetical protein